MSTADQGRVVWFNDGKQPNVADVLGRVSGVEMSCLEFDDPPDRQWGALEKAHIYCITSTRDEVPDEFKATAGLLGRCPTLVCVSTSGAGYDPVDVDACTRFGVLVVNQAGANAQAVAEHAVGMMLSLSKRMGETDRSLRRERGIARENFKGWNVEGKTIGLIGLGNTGRRVARICGAGLGMRIVAYDPYLSPDTIEERGAASVNLDVLLAQSDFVSVHCPYGPETHDMLSASSFALMRRGTFIINCARGGIVNEADLAAALSRGDVAGAGIDVWSNEPPPLDHPLLALDTVIATNHTAGVTHDSRENMANWNAEQVRQILRGMYPPRLINPGAWDAFAARYERIFSRPVADKSEIG
ncbi:MAG: hydroxyacid dehydrogenase [Pseudomonadota bacterium]